MNLNRAFASGLLLIGIAVSLPPAAAEDALRAASAWPRAQVFTKNALEFIDKLNGAGAGVVQIRFIGGPEAVPTSEQPQAVRSGVLDMVTTAAGFYPGLVPEALVIAASTKAPWEVRVNGGMDMLQEIWNKRMNVHLLGWIGSGVSFNFFVTKEPRRTPSGGVDLTGLSLRSSPIFRDFIRALNGNPVDMFIPEVFTALERGVVQGLATATNVVGEFGWDKFLRHRIEPSFFQTDVTTIVNLDKWKSLSAKSRELLQSSFIAWERATYDHYQRVLAEQVAEQERRGIKPLKLEGEAAKAYQELAYGGLWKQLAAAAPDNYQRLREKF